MLDKSIPYKNIFMKCTQIKENAMMLLPDNYSFKLYEDGDEKYWAAIELAVGEFEHMTQEQVEEYFRKEYFTKKEELYQRCLFVFGSDKKPVGTCMAWFDHIGEQEVASIHWFAVDPKVQTHGIGRALLSEAMGIFYFNDEMPVYLHTQPWSYKAIKLYLDFGFYALKEETLNHETNDFAEASLVLEKLINRQYHARFMDTAE